MAGTKRKSFVKTIKFWRMPVLLPFICWYPPTKRSERLGSVLDLSFMTCKVAPEDIQNWSLNIQVRFVGRVLEFLKPLTCRVFILFHAELPARRYRYKIIIRVHSSSALTSRSWQCSGGWCKGGWTGAKTRFARWLSFSWHVKKRRVRFLKGLQYCSGSLVILHQRKSTGWYSQRFTRRYPRSEGLQTAELKRLRPSKRVVKEIVHGRSTVLLVKDRTLLGPVLCYTCWRNGLHNILSSWALGCNPMFFQSQHRSLLI